MRAFLVPALALMLSAATPAAAQTPVADTILVNGKIVTVDDRFTVAEALAIRDRRIVAVGTNAEIGKLKGPQTRTIELAGRTVIPGLIDNHSHWIRAAEHNELRFDGVTTRKRADRAADRTRARRQARRMDRGPRRLVGRAVHRRGARLSRVPSSIPSRRTIRWCCNRSITTASSTARR